MNDPKISGNSQEQGNKLLFSLTAGLWPLSKVFRPIPAKERGKIIILLVMMAIGVGLIILGGRSQEGKQEEKIMNSKPAAARVLTENPKERWAEERVENQLLSALARIKGVGRVKVDITYSASAEDEWVYRLKEEERINEDKSGGVVREWRREREPVLRREKDGLEEPIRLKTLAPRIAGVLVVAEGCEDPLTKERLWKATATLLGIPIHRVMILPWGE